MVLDIFDRSKTYDFFISYSREDAASAIDVVNSLGGSGVDIFLDEIEIGWGESINDLVFSGLQSARHLVVLISKHSLNSAWVRKELSTVLTREINESRTIILPILMDDQNSYFEALPFMRDKKYLRYTGASALAEVMVQTARGSPTSAQVYNHPRKYKGPVWIRLSAAAKNDNQKHSVTITWGPWHRECRIVLKRAVPLFLMHSKGHDDESFPIRVRVEPDAHIGFGQGIPPGVEKIDVNPFWVDAKSRLKRLYARMFLWPRDSQRRSR